jgi:hypothetical protein
VGLQRLRAVFYSNSKYGFYFDSPNLYASNYVKKEITIFRDLTDSRKASILYRELSTPVVASQN